MAEELLNDYVFAEEPYKEEKKKRTDVGRE